MGEILSVSEHSTLHETLPTLFLLANALDKNRDRDTDTLCCETLIASVCLQLGKEQCRSCEITRV